MGVKNFLEKVFKVTGTNTETVVSGKCNQHGRDESVQQRETCKRPGLLLAERSTEQK